MKHSLKIMEDSFKKAETTFSSIMQSRRKLGIALIATTLLISMCCGAVGVAGIATGAIALLRRNTNDVVYSPDVVAASEEQKAQPTPTREPQKQPSPTPRRPTATPTPTKPPPAPTPTVALVLQETKDRQARVFRSIWETVRDTYLYPDFNGVDWQKTKQETEIKIQSGLSDDAFYEYVDGVIEQLNDNHSYYLSPQGARDEDKEYDGTLQYVGVGLISDINEEKGYLYVLQVLPGSPAEKAGIRKHDHILKIDGQPSVSEGRSQSKQMRGEQGSSLKLIARTPGKEPREVTLTREEISASEQVEYRVIEGQKRIGYLLIPTFFEDDIDERVRDALKALNKGGKLDGLIVDMRINGGGAYDVLRPTLGFFGGGVMGNLMNKKGVGFSIRAKAENVGNSQSVPMTILIGPSTESYAEVFSGALQAKGRAKLIGQPTAGNVETLFSHEFEDGSRLWLAEEGFKLPNGESWEGEGLRPDITVATQWDEHTDEDDPVIAAAVRLLSE